MARSVRSSAFSRLLSPRWAADDGGVHPWRYTRPASASWIRRRSAAARAAARAHIARGMSSSLKSMLACSRPAPRAALTKGAHLPDRRPFSWFTARATRPRSCSDRIEHRLGLRQVDAPVDKGPQVNSPGSARRARPRHRPAPAQGHRPAMDVELDHILPRERVRRRHVACRTRPRRRHRRVDHAAIVEPLRLQRRRVCCAAAKEGPAMVSACGPRGAQCRCRPRRRA